MSIEILRYTGSSIVIHDGHAAHCPYSHFTVYSCGHFMLCEPHYLPIHCPEDGAPIVTSVDCNPESTSQFFEQFAYSKYCMEQKREEE